jgi:antitoxin (DNA-binding transcriptional repressor) of toxin-antitoxin stability system
MRYNFLPIDFFEVAFFSIKGVCYATGNTIKRCGEKIAELVQKAIQGNEIIIVMGDKPVATLSPFITKKHARKLGTAKGQITVKNDFKEIPEEFKDYIP